MKGYLLVLMVLAGIFLSSSVFGFGLLNLSSPQNYSEIGGSFMFVGTEGWNYSLLGVAQDVGNCVDLYDVGLDSRFRSVIRGNIPGLWPQSFSENCSGHFLAEFACGNEINRSLNVNGVAGLKSALGVDDAAFNKLGMVFVTVAWPTIFDKFRAPKLADCADGRLLWNCSSDVNCSNGRQWSVYCDGQNVVMDAITSAFCIAPGTNSGCGMNVVKSVAVDCGGKGCNMSSGECFTSRPSEPCVTQLDGTACVDASGNGGVCSSGSCYVDQLKLGLVLYAPFDDSTADDKSGNGYVANYSGAIAYCSGCGVRNSGAYNFDGVNDYINYTNFKGVIDQRNDNFSVAVWFRANLDGTPGRNLVALMNTSNGSAWLGVDSATCGDNKLFSYVNKSCLNVPTALSNDTWYYAVFVSNVTNQSIYLNGVKANFMNRSINPAIGTIALGVHVNFAAAWYKGLMDEVRVYKRALSDTEVEQLYNLSCPIACSSDGDCGSNMFCTNGGRCDAKCLGEILYFSFDDRANPVLDLSGRGYQGIVNDANWISEGKVGGAYNFTGASSNISVRSFPRLSNYTVSAWIKPFAFDTGLWREIIFDGASSATSWGLFVSMYGYLSSRISDGGYNFQDWSIEQFSSSNYSGWHHIALTDNGTVSKFYRDGFLVNTIANTLTNKEYVANISIGAYGNGKVFNGLIDEFRIFNYALNDSQIKGLYCPTGISCINSSDCSPGYRCDNARTCNSQCTLCSACGTMTAMPCSSGTCINPDTCNSCCAACTSDSNCDDGNPATYDRCVGIGGCDAYCFNAVAGTGKIVYQDDRNGNWDIYMYDFGTGVETPITNNPANQTKPKVYGNRVVWSDDRNGNWDIYMYDLSTGIETLISDDNFMGQYRQDPGSIQDDGIPDIYGDKIVWMSQVRFTSNQDLVMYDLSTNTEKVLSTSQVADVSIYGDLVAYTKFPVSDGVFHILTHNLSDDSSVRVGTNKSEQDNPSVYGDKIVWDDTRFGYHQIFVYSVGDQTERRITNYLGNNLAAKEPDIYGDIVVYAIINATMEGTGAIHMFNLSSNTETVLTKGGNNGYPSIYGNRAVYMSNRNGNWDIYMYDLRSKTEFQITSNSASQMFPDLYVG